MDRKNINRGFKRLRVWQDAVSLYGEIVKIDPKTPDPNTEVMRF